MLRSVTEGTCDHCTASRRRRMLACFSSGKQWLGAILTFSFLVLPNASAADEFLARAALLNDEFDFAYELYSDLYEDGNQEAAFVLGLMYREGWGVEADDGRAREFLSEARSRGHVEASYWLCRDAYAEAVIPAEFDAVADLCMPASGQSTMKTTRGFIYHPHHVPLAKLIAGEALLKAGSEKTAFLCLVSAHSLANRDYRLHAEVKHIETTLAQYSPRWYIGNWRQERPYDDHYGPNDEVPPCMIRQAAAVRLNYGDRSPVLRGVFSALGLR